MGGRRFCWGWCGDVVVEIKSAKGNKKRRWERPGIFGWAGDLPLNAGDCVSASVYRVKETPEGGWRRLSNYSGHQPPEV